MRSYARAAGCRLDVPILDTAVPPEGQKRSAGLYSYGLNSYGLHSYGLRSYGLRSYGLRSYGLRSYGLCQNTGWCWPAALRRLFGLYSYGL